MDWPFGRAHEVPHAVEIVMVGSPACHLVRVEHVRAGYAIACEQTTVAHRHDEGVQIRRILEDLEADGCGARGGDLALAAGVQGASGGPGAFAATRSYSTTGGFCSIVSPTCPPRSPDPRRRGKHALAGTSRLERALGADRSNTALSMPSGITVLHDSNTTMELHDSNDIRSIGLATNEIAFTTGDVVQ
jgi:hypothetical protein